MEGGQVEHKKNVKDNSRLQNQNAPKDEYASQRQSQEKVLLLFLNRKKSHVKVQGVTKGEGRKRKRSEE